MEFNRPLESNLPPDEFEVLVALVAEHYTYHSTLTNDIFESSFKTVDYTHHLARILHGDDNDRAVQAVSRAFHFAVEINQLAGLQQGSIRPTDDFPESMPPEELRENLLNKSTDFMSRNLALDTVTARFMPELDPTGEYCHLVDSVVGLTSLQLERGYKKAVVDNEINSWDGTISELGTP